MLMQFFIYKKPNQMLILFVIIIDISTTRLSDRLK